MQERSIVELIEERIDKGDIELPIFHRIAMKLQQLLARDNYNATDIDRIIKKDQALASHVLKVANSAFYAGLSPIKTIQDAVVRMGVKSILNLVMVVNQRQLYRPKTKEFGHWMNPLWSHSLGAAAAGRWLALNLGLHKLAEESFMAGLLHDIGKLLLLRIIEDLQKSRSLTENISVNVIDDILETMHSSQGERLMHKLNMPEIYCNVVARHHEEKVKGEDVRLNLVRLANLACHKLCIGPRHDPGLMLSTTPEAINLMVTDLLLAELQVKLEEYMTSEQKLLSVN